MHYYYYYIYNILICIKFLAVGSLDNAHKNKNIQFVRFKLCYPTSGPQQDDVIDCGIFVIEFMAALVAQNFKRSQPFKVQIALFTLDDKTKCSSLNQ